MRSFVVLLGLLLTLLAVSALMIRQAGETSHWIVIPDLKAVDIPREELPFHVVLGGWVTGVGALVVQKPEAAPRNLRMVGLDPASETVLAVGKIARELSEHMGPRELSRRYDEAEKAEILTKRVERDIKDRYRLDRAAFLGSAIGAWLAALEAEGVDTRKLVHAIFNDPHFSVSQRFDPSKLEMMHRDNEVFLAAMEAKLGHGFEEADQH